MEQYKVQITMNVYVESDGTLDENDIIEAALEKKMLDLDDCSDIQVFKRPRKI